ncbi:MAG: transporter [Gemmatimonadetes bacterium]|nr:transporter [Gemmatimonadota bacterium]
MVRKSLLVATLLVTAAPLAAQDVEWTSKRPDGQAPLGVLDGQLLNAGEFRISYRFTQMDYRGMWLDNDSIPVDQLVDSYAVVPLKLFAKTHEVGVGYAPRSDLTFTARLSYSQRDREQLTSASGLYSVSSAKGLGDLQVNALYSVFNQGAVRAHIQVGALVPTGRFDVTGATPVSTDAALPYDMRPGGGTWALISSLTMLAENEAGSVGAQARGTFHAGTNSSSYSPGNAYDFTAWAAYRLNDYFSVSGRARYMRWDGMKGADPALDPTLDPGNDAYSIQGRRLDIPVGLNIYLPQGIHLGGNRLSVEYVYPVSQHYRGPQLGADWGVTVGWQTVF